MNIFLLHAIFAFLAWGLVAPVATINSTFRRILYGQTSPLWDRRENPDDLQGRAWVNLHRYLNETVILFTWISFSLAAVGVRTGHHFRNAHQVVGLVMFLLTFPMWALGRVLMPPKHPRNGNYAIQSTTEQTRLVPGGDEYCDNVHEMASIGAAGSRKESFLVWTHRLLGVGVLVAGLWEIYSGISLYSKLSVSGDNLIVCYFSWCGVLILLVAILIFLCLMKRSSRRK
jgi:hypothetical protein